MTSPSRAAGGEVGGEGCGEPVLETGLDGEAEAELVQQFGGGEQGGGLGGGGEDEADGEQITRGAAVERDAGSRRGLRPARRARACAEGCQCSGFGEELGPGVLAGG